MKAGHIWLLDASACDYKTWDVFTASKQVPWFSFLKIDFEPWTYYSFFFPTKLSGRIKKKKKAYIL